MNTQTFEPFDTSSYHRFTNPSIVEKDLRTITGILAGIRSDNVISSREHYELTVWLKSMRQYENKQPYKDLIWLIRDAIEDNILTEDECKNITWYCNQYINRIGYYDAFTAGIQQLVGVLQGIVIDEVINNKELSYLDTWLEDNSHLKNSWPYDEIYNLTTSIIQDEVITKEEHEAFMNFAKAIVGSSDKSNEALLSTLKTGFYQIDPLITINERTFCITGLSKKFKRKEIAEKIELYGGYVIDSVSSKLNYLVVCDEKNTCWAFTCYGRKIEEAIKHRRNGLKLSIVHEYDLYDTLESM